MLAPSIQISPLTKIRRQRVLPIPGLVLVRQGQPVEVKTAVAEAELEPKHILLHIDKALHVSSQKADQLIQRSIGEFVNQDDLIAGPVGIMRRVVRAPQDGEIVMAGEGQVLIKINQPAYELRAGMPGTVTDLVPGRGAVIETVGALVQGVWGNGHSTFGLIQSKLNAPDDELAVDHLDMSQRGAILLGGHCANAQIFQKATEIPLRGLVLVSMASALIPLAKKRSLPILVLEGFGRKALNTMSYNVLTTNKEREIAVNAEPTDHTTGDRPEVVIPLKAAEENVDEGPTSQDLAPGTKIRVVRAPHTGKIATIETIFTGPVKLPSGLHVPAALVRFENDHQASVPIANMEVVI